MKLLYLATTALALGAASDTANAHTLTAETVSPAQFIQIFEAIPTSSKAVGLHLGDFQANTRAVKVQQLYKGDGASLMYTVRRMRD